MNTNQNRIAVVGAGIAGSACARLLVNCGFAVTVFDKSRGIGGRMATRRFEYQAAEGGQHSIRFDHGAPAFSLHAAETDPLLRRFAGEGLLRRWQPHVQPPNAFDDGAPLWVATPDMPALCRALLSGIDIHTDFAVAKITKSAEGEWTIADSSGISVGAFTHVVVAIPPKQAEALLAGCDDSLTALISQQQMLPCWTLMALSDDTGPNLSWDIMRPASGPLDWVIRNDTKPDRQRIPGLRQWVAHANANWSQANLELNADEVLPSLKSALDDCLGTKQNWRHATVHRWRYANALGAASKNQQYWWSAENRIGICGDAVGGGGVTGAWRSATALANFLANDRAGSQARGHVVSPTLAQPMRIL